MASEMYLYRLESGDYCETKRMVLLNKRSFWAGRPWCIDSLGWRQTIAGIWRGETGRTHVSVAVTAEVPIRIFPYRIPANAALTTRAGQSRGIFDRLRCAA